MQDRPQLFSISQATTATFTDLYFRMTFLFFIQAGTKHVSDEGGQTMIGREGDLLICPPGALITMQNRPLLDADYRAVGLSFSDEMIAEVFAQNGVSHSPSIQMVRKQEHNPEQLLPLIVETFENDALPDAILHNRLLEPLLWLRHHGFSIRTQEEEPVAKVRRLIESDLSHPWNSRDVAQHFAMSEATMRRWLAKSGQGFAKIVLYTRLESALTLLQTSDRPIIDIALQCGFKSPSHFAEAFKKRFGITPREIRIAQD